jgi:hypothetical protein
MPKTAFADTLLEWDSLLAAMDEPEILNQPHMRQLRDQLEVMIQNTRALAAEQAALEGRRQAVTQQLRITRRKGQDLVVRVRSAIRSHFGHRFEGLVRFRIRPVRRRSRATREEIGIAETGSPVEPPPVDEMPASQEAVPAVDGISTPEV